MDPIDPIIKNQLQFYTPPRLIQDIFQNEKKCFQIAKYIIDREFKHKPQRWKTVALPEYDDFFQAAISGFNPYKGVTEARDKGLLQAVESYHPYRKQEEVDGGLLLEVREGIEQAMCPLCNKRGDQTSLWPSTAGNDTVPPEDAPEPLFHKGDKYCGKEIFPSSKTEQWLTDGLLRSSGKKFYCNYQSRLASLKKYIVQQIGFLIKDIRSAEYHKNRSLKRHPFYPCPKCSSLNPDFNTSTVNKTEKLTCLDCKHIFNIKDFGGRNSGKIVWQARGATSTLSISDHSAETDGRSSYEEIISNYSLNSTTNDQSVHHNLVEQEKSALFDQLISRIRELAASSLSKKQYDKLVNDPEVVKVEGTPETQNFQIFYEYFFIDDVSKKKTHFGKTKDSGDESSTYRDLAYRYLRKEQHYTQCSSCDHKMYEPTESAKFKRSGPRTSCEECLTHDVRYHSPKCGRPNGKNPQCADHSPGGKYDNIEIVMYIFQTIEPKIRRLEELVKNDNQAQDIYERIQELLMAREDMEAHQDMMKLLNY